MAIDINLINNGKIVVHPGINDLPTEPTTEKAGNGSHLIQQHNALVDSMGSLLPELLPQAFDYWHDFGTIENSDLGGKPLFPYAAPNQYHGFLGEASTPSPGDYFGFKINLAEKYYDLILLGARGPDCGILTVIVNGATFAVIDFYAAQPENNSLGNARTDFMPNGLANFLFLTTGKNSASTGYRMPLTKIAVRSSYSP